MTAVRAIGLLTSKPLKRDDTLKSCFCATAGEIHRCALVTVGFT